MRPFLTKSLTFALLVVAATSTLILLVNFAMRRGHYFDMGRKAELLMVGDSHPECAFNDSIISHSANFSSSGESYFYGFLKVKMLLKKNPQVKTIFIEFNNGQIEKAMDENIWGDKHIDWRYPKYSAYMGIEEIGILMSHNWKTTVHAQFISLRDNVRFLVRRSKSLVYYGGWGAYHPLRHDGSQLLAQYRNNRVDVLDSLVETSPTNLLYLSKMIEFCRNRDVVVFLIRSPVHPKYRGLANEKTFQQVLQGQFAGVEFLDFVTFSADDTEFADLHHLNYKGAQRYSTLLESLLKNGLLNTDKKQDIIDREISKT